MSHHRLYARSLERHERSLQNCILLPCSNRRCTAAWTGAGSTRASRGHCTARPLTPGVRPLSVGAHNLSSASAVTAAAAQDNAKGESCGQSHTCATAM